MEMKKRSRPTYW